MEISLMMYDQFQEDLENFFLSSFFRLQNDYSMQVEANKALFILITIWMPWNIHMKAYTHPTCINLYLSCFACLKLSCFILSKKLSCFTMSHAYLPSLIIYLFSQSWAIEVKLSGVKLICSRGRQIRCE